EEPAARAGDMHPCDRPHNEPREDEEGGERDPLPEADLEKADLEERRRQEARERTPAVLRIEGRNRGDGARGDLPDRRAGRFGHPPPHEPHPPRPPPPRPPPA